MPRRIRAPKKTETDPVPGTSLLVGLRNPGSEYAGTRHNVGAEVIAAVAARHEISFKKARRGIRADIAEVRIDGSPVVLALPRTFMNESGQAVAPLMRYFGVLPESLLVCHDDIDLPFAKLRVQAGRGSGGNNGVESIMRAIGTREFWRLKFGVGRPPGRMDPADFVLRRFATVERAEVDLVLQTAADVVETFARDGGEAARQAAGEANPAT